ncbi:MAG: hypothetical protein ACE5GO_06080 [Anaerolineales bacterium]
MELTDDLKTLFMESELHGWARRTFMVKVVNQLGKGGQRRATAELGRKPMLSLTSILHPITRHQ